MGLLKQINSDLHHCGSRSIHRKALTFLFNVSFRLTLNYRLGYYLAKRRNFIVNIILLYLKKRQLVKYGCDISYQAIIGKNISFPHPIGIVIGVGTVIGDNVKIWQHVTFGSKGEATMSYPNVKSNVKIFSSAQIIGGVTIGENAKVGAFSLVLKDVPDNATAIGIPAKTK
ncbi:serine O-acetyltransferase [Flavobacterium litorale]|uniref:Serine acetyltransferase n=1 Tax=Flavobacterium litorale TaxID=2856519 RepID=A0ABX8V3B9_9FLAO|nr:serine acetyltransferase [Flavobacterium litorale]QYJ67295.1 serine acetyltransferase [Flavobacterium litorale]